MIKSIIVATLISSEKMQKSELKTNRKYVYQNFI